MGSKALKFIDLHIDGFGKFKDYELKFEPGINIIYGKNEAGKSTLHTFLKAMLYGMGGDHVRAGKKSAYDSLRPWNGEEVYKGRLRIEHEGRNYTIERDFSISGDDLSVYDENGSKLKDPAVFMNTALRGISESAYVNTVSIGQLKSETDKGMAVELKRYIRNLNTTVSLDLNSEKAIEYLKSRKAELMKGLDEDAARRYTLTAGRIKNLENELKDPGNENNIQYYTSVRSSLKTEVKDTETDIEGIAADIRKNEEVLLAKDLRSKADIAEKEAEASRLWGEFGEAERKYKSGLMRNLAILCFVAAVAVTAVFFFRFGFEYMPYFAAAAAVLFILGIALLVKRNIDVKNYNKLSSGFGMFLMEYTDSDDADAGNYEAFRSKMKEFRSVCDTVDKLKRDKTSRDDALFELARKQSYCTEELERQQSARILVEQKLLELNALKNQAAELKQIIAQNDRIKDSIDSIDMAVEKLDELGRSIALSAGRYINKTAGEYIEKITGGVYHTLDVGDNFDAELHAGSRVIRINEVSAGTVDQIYLALRLAAAKFIEGGEFALPLVLDDSFLQYDDDRIESAVRFINETCSCQVLMFTCHRREERILTAAAIPYRLCEL